MTERYTRVFTLDKQIYQNDSPVIISAGALLKDTSNNSILAQIKFKNITDKVIKALRVSVQPLSTSGAVLGKEIEYQYLDLHVVRDGEFGQKEAVRVPDNNTRQFTIKILETTFEDRTSWLAESYDSEQFDSAVTLKDGLNDELELINQYKLDYGQDCEFIPETHDKFWVCACGGINHTTEEKCHLCGKEINRLLPVDIEALKERKTIRLKDKAYDEAVQLAKQDTVSVLGRAIEMLNGISGWKDSEELIHEYEKRIEELKDQMQKQAAIDEENKKKKTAKRKKGIMIGMGVLAVMVVLMVLLFLVIIPGGHIKNGDRLLAEGNYDEAIAEYEAANNSDKVMEAKYQKAKWLAESESFDEAVKTLEEIKGYQNSEELLKEYKGEAKYLEAYAAYQAGQYKNAYIKLVSMRGLEKADELLSTMQVVPISITGKPVSYASGSYTEMISLAYNDDGSLKTIMRTELGDKDIFNFDSNGEFINYEGDDTSFNRRNSDTYNEYGIPTNSYLNGEMNISLDDHHNPTGPLPGIGTRNCQNRYETVFGDDALTNTKVIMNRTDGSTVVMNDFTFEYGVVLKNENCPIDKIWYDLRRYGSIYIWSIY